MTNRPKNKENTMTDQPLRLAVGSHSAGTGKGCAMNVISWENGDTTITDYPGCADRMLSRAVQIVNDTICTHRDGDLLCPPCSMKVLDLAHRTVGTAGLLERRGYAQLAVWCARQVEDLSNDPRTARAIAAAEAWIADPSPAANAAAAHAAAYAAAYAAAHAAAYAAARAAAYAAAAYAAAAYADDVLQFGHRLVDEFNRITGRVEGVVAPDVTERAIRSMTTVA